MVVPIIINKIIIVVIVVIHNNIHKITVYHLRTVLVVLVYLITCLITRAAGWLLFHPAPHRGNNNSVANNERTIEAVWQCPTD